MNKQGASYQDTAIQFKIHNFALIASGNKKFLDKGIEGLRRKSEGDCLPLSKKTKITPTTQENTMSCEEQLERENELLRLEVAYLKKLKVFLEILDAFLEKHK